MSSYREGERVSNVDETGGIFGDAVRAGSKGEVVETRHGLLNEYATVQFDNGRTEEINVTNLRRETGWY